MPVPLEARVVAAAAVAGAVVGAAIGLAGSTSYRASVTMLVARGSALPSSSEAALQGARTVSALVETDAVSSRVAAELRLDDAAVARSLTASPRGSTGLVVLTAAQADPQRAIRLAQQAGLVVSQLVLTRFGSTGLRASIWDPAKTAVAERPSPGLDAGLGAAAAAALAGLALAAVRLRPRRVRDGPSRAVAAEPGAVPAFEREMGAEPGAVPGFEPETRAETGAVPASEPAPPPPQPLVLEPLPNRFDVHALEQAVAHADPRRRDELDAYLDALRPQADTDGLLPAALANVVREVFAGVL